MRELLTQTTTQSRSVLNNQTENNAVKNQTVNILPLAQTSGQKEFWNKLSPVNRVATSDTYKRTMSGSSELFANNFSCYNLAARKAISETGANGRLIVAGLEKILYPWFSKPITKEEIDSAKEFFTTKAQVSKFPEKIWQMVLDNDGFFPIDIYALPGGQTFLAKDKKHVPLISVEGVGGLVSHLEPHLESMYAPIIQATKARLFKEVVGKKFAEFGLRCSEIANDHITLMMALYVGGRFSLTSDDQAAFLFPKYFKDIGTVGHEFIMAYQQEGKSLLESQEEAYEAFVQENQRSALLPDVISTKYAGLPSILKLVKKYPQKEIFPRFDSGDVALDSTVWLQMTSKERLPETTIVVEDGFTPTKANITKEKYVAYDGDSEKIIVGAGGYFKTDSERDTISLAYKRSATMHNGKLEYSLKFSDSPGKESIPGQVRIYAKDRTLIVAQADESIDGESLMQKVVSNGRIFYSEDLDMQRNRAEQTWNAYDRIEYSPRTKEMIEKRIAEKQNLLKEMGGT